MIASVAVLAVALFICIFILGAALVAILYLWRELKDAHRQNRHSSRENRALRDEKAQLAADKQQSDARVEHFRSRCAVEEDVASGLKSCYSNEAKEHAELKEENAAVLRKLRKWHALATHFASILDSNARRREREKLFAELAEKMSDLTNSR